MACSKSLYHEMVDTFTLSSPLCKQKDSEGCWIEFKLQQLVGEDFYKAEVMKQRGTLIMKHTKMLFPCFSFNSIPLNSMLSF